MLTALPPGGFCRTAAGLERLRDVSSSGAAVAHLAVPFVWKAQEARVYYVDRRETSQKPTLPQTSLARVDVVYLMRGS